MGLNKGLSTKQSSRALAGEVLRRVLYGDFDMWIERLYPDGGEAEYRDAIRRAGNPPDQIQRFERAGIVMQPKQLELAAWARRMDTAEHVEGEQGAPELAMGGARGPGKSFGFFAQVAVDDCQRQPGAKWLYLRKIGKGAQEQLIDLRASVLKRVPHEFTRGQILFPNGSRIITGHFKTETEALNYLGLQYDGILLEEATLLRMEIAYKALRNALRTSDPGWRPRIYSSTNPLGIQKAVHRP